MRQAGALCDRSYRITSPDALFAQRGQFRIDIDGHLSLWLGFVVAFDDERELAAWLVEMLDCLHGRASEDLLVELSQFATDDKPSVAEHASKIVQGLLQSMGRFERHNRIRRVLQLRVEPSPRA